MASHETELCRRTFVLNSRSLMEPVNQHHASSAGDPGGLGTTLSGKLVCFRCKYDLVGLSVRSVCPECGTPIHATLLAVVDPHARELRPLTRPWLTAIGMMVWALGAVGAVLVLWWMRGRMMIAGDIAAFDSQWIAAMGRAGIYSMVLSGLGALVLIRPHDAVPKAWKRMAILGVLLYIPLIALNWYVLMRLDPIIGSPYPPERIVSVLFDRTLPRVGASLVLAAIIVLLRPCARMLAARSLVMRTGRVDRQTMFALIATIGLWTLGDLAYVLAPFSPDALEQGFLVTGMMFIGAGSLLFTIGLGLLVVDVARLCPVLIEPAPAIGDVVGEEGRGDQAPGIEESGGTTGDGGTGG